MKDDQMFKVDEIKTIAIAGAGTMGTRIGLQAAICGWNTVILDLKESILDKSKNVQEKLLNSFREKKGWSDKDISDITNRITHTLSARQAGSQADLVIEAVTEDIATKLNLWNTISEVCPGHTVFTTNTSFLLPSMFADHSGRPDKFCAFHFHNVFTANVVDIMPHSHTAPWIVELLKDVGKKMEQIPIVISRESSGYQFNDMLLKLLYSAAKLHINGVGTFQDIDRSWMGNFKTSIGPFGMLDRIGLDTAWHVINNNEKTANNEISRLLNNYVKQGRLGIKSGAGFYTYPNPEFAQKDFLES